MNVPLTNLDIVIFIFLSSHFGLEMDSVFSSLQLRFVVVVVEGDDAEAVAAVAVEETAAVVVAVVVAVSVNESEVVGTVVRLRLFASTDCCWNRIAGLIQTNHSSSLMHRLGQLGLSTPSDAGFLP